LIIFEAIATDPGGALRELYAIQNNKNIGLPGLVKKARIRDEIGLVGG
jgi:hypothetical protein